MQRRSDSTATTVPSSSSHWHLASPTSFLLSSIGMSTYLSLPSSDLSRSLLVQQQEDVLLPPNSPSCNNRSTTYISSSSSSASTSPSSSRRPSSTNLVCLHRKEDLLHQQHVAHFNDSTEPMHLSSSLSPNSTTVSLHFPSKYVAPLTLHLATCANDHILHQVCEVCGGGGNGGNTASALTPAAATHFAASSVGSGVSMLYLAPTYSLDATYEVTIPEQLQHLLDYREFTLAIDRCNAACALNSTWPWLFFIIGVILLIVCAMLPSLFHFPTSSPQGIICIIFGIFSLGCGYILATRKCKQLERRRLQALSDVIEEENRREVMKQQQAEVRFILTERRMTISSRPMLRWSLIKLFASSSSSSNAATQRHIQVEILCNHGINGVLRTPVTQPLSISSIVEVVPPAESTVSCRTIPESVVVDVDPAPETLKVDIVEQQNMDATVYSMMCTTNYGTTTPTTPT